LWVRCFAGYRLQSISNRVSTGSPAYEILDGQLVNPLI
jgi:hypothetical protein